jgi:CTP:molybdopterin cytidylyltransferase MocA
VIREFVTERSGVPEVVWRRSRDMDYLVNCAERLEKDGKRYAENIYGIIAPRLSTDADRSELRDRLQFLAKRSLQLGSVETDIFIAQAIEIVANDYWLIQRMITHNAPSRAIIMLKSTMVSGAIEVGRRLFCNAVRRIQAMKQGCVELDPSRIMKLGQVWLDQKVETESWATKIMPSTTRIHVVVNAGRSTRLRTTIPKGVIYLDDRPLIRYTIDAGKAAGFEQSVVVLGFKKDINEQFLRNDVSVVTQPSVKGTAHAVMSSGTALADFTGTLLVSYSDMPFITSVSLQRLVDMHEKSGAMLTILTTSSDRRPEFGKLVQNAEGHYLRIAQPRVEETLSDQADAGFYCFRCPDIWHYLEEVENRNNRYEYYLTDIMTILSSAGVPILGVETKDEIETLGINKPADLSTALEIGYLIHKKCYSHRQLHIALSRIRGKTESELLDYYKYQVLRVLSDRHSHDSYKGNLNINRIRQAISNQVGAILEIQT